MAQQRGSGGKGGALVVGASSGIGEALAGHLVAAGYQVALVARRLDRLQALCDSLNAKAAGNRLALAYAHDVNAYDETPALFARIASEIAPLRLVIYAAGVMPTTTTGAAFDADRAMIETNVVGAMRWLGLAADYLEGAGGGTLVGISSVAGDRGRPGNGAYQASKAALSSYLDSLRFRLKARGVHVVTIKPGYVATPMTAGANTPKALTTSADFVARAIVRASERGAAVVYTPGYWRPIMWVIRHAPAGVVARLK